jgi:hypothetical protein
MLILPALTASFPAGFPRIDEPQMQGRLWINHYYAQSKRSLCMSVDVTSSVSEIHPI